jgi:hypothetical protein
MLEITPLLLVYAAVTTGAVIMAALADCDQRREAFLCASMLLANWLITIAAWTPWGIHRLLERFGIPAHPEDVWAGGNAIAGLLTLAVIHGDGSPMHSQEWGRLLFGLLLAGCYNCVGFELFGNWQIYSRISDVIFLAEEAIFFALGGPHVYSMVGRYADRISSLYRVKAHLQAQVAR